MPPSAPGPVVLDPETRKFYLHALAIVGEAKVPFLVGGAYALGRYTGIERHTKDFDLFVRPADASRTLEAFGKAGYRTDLTFPHWLGKAYHGEHFVDVIFRSGNGIAEVDDAWFEHAVPEEVLGVPVGLCPAEEVLWSKGFIQERERYDGADVAHLIRARGEQLDWPRLLRRYGEDWRVLLGHLVLFGFIYPGERSKVPARVLDELLGRLRDETAAAPPGERVCRGPLLSREQYLIDISEWGYQDARLAPRGRMTDVDISHWTAAIDRSS